MPNVAVFVVVVVVVVVVPGGSARRRPMSWFLVCFRFLDSDA